MTVRFIHTADWQIGKPFAGIRDPLKRSLVQQARVEVLRRIGEAAREADAEFIVVAGDLFDSFSADKATVSAACSAIGQMDRPVFVIPGNHDHGGPGSTWAQEFFRREQASLSPNLTVLLEPKPYECDSAILLPCPLLRRNVSSDTTEWLRQPDLYTGLPGEKPRIVLAHGSTQAFSGQWDDDEEGGAGGNLIDLSRLPKAGIDYVALGDWHGTRQVAPNAWYSGTPELDRFAKGSDHDPGNILVVEAHRDEPPCVTPKTTACLHWNALTIDVADDLTLDQLEERIASLIGQRANQDLLNLTLTGSIGIQAATGLERMLESLVARILRLKLTDQTRIAPTEAEIDALTRRSGDPLTASVAAHLVERAAGEDEDALIARIALRELHAACTTEEAS